MITLGPKNRTEKRTRDGLDKLPGKAERMCKTIRRKRKPKCKPDWEEPLAATYFIWLFVWRNNFLEKAGDVAEAAHRRLSSGWYRSKLRPEDIEDISQDIGELYIKKGVKFFEYEGVREAPKNLRDFVSNACNNMCKNRRTHGEPGERRASWKAEPWSVNGCPIDDHFSGAAWEQWKNSRQHDQPYSNEEVNNVFDQLTDDEQIICVRHFIEKDTMTNINQLYLTNYDYKGIRDFSAKTREKVGRLLRCQRHPKP